MPLEGSGYVLRQVQRIALLSQVTSVVFLAGCSGSGGTGQPYAATPQMVFMMPTNVGVFPPGPNNIPWEIVVMNLDGSGRRQLTSDGKFKFLPHFSPDGSKIVHTKYARGGYGDPNAQTDVFVYDLATAQETRLTQRQFWIREAPGMLGHTLTCA
jgi:Tol biopolymer transport system component